MMKFRRTLLAISSAAAVATALATFSAGALAQANYKAEYKMSLVLGPPTPWGQAGKIWADLVKERTQGRINIKLYPGVSLIQGDQTREFLALRQGVIDMAVGSTINWSPQVKELNLFSMPFLMPDYAAIDALTQGEVGKDIFARLKTDGIVFDAEVIYLVRRLDYRYAIVPVMWHDIRGSRMRVRLRLGLSVLWDLFRIPLIHRGVRATVPAPRTSDGL